MLKAEYITYQNAVLNWQDYWTVDSCVQQSVASCLVGTGDFFGMRLCNRWIKHQCHLATEFAVLFTKEFVFDFCGAAYLYKQRIW